MDLTEVAMPIPHCGCWIGMGKKTTPGGYVFYKDELGHRAIWIQTYGYPPTYDRWEVHHKCGVRSCWNPDHLEVVTSKQHKQHHPNQYAEASHCVHGHEFTEANTYFYPDGKRGCKACRRAYNREYMRNRRHP